MLILRCFDFQSINIGPIFARGNLGGSAGNNNNNNNTSTANNNTEAQPNPGNPPSGELKILEAFLGLF
jgi:hypothetical protein